MDNDKIIEVKNRALLRFSKEALALYIERQNYFGMEMILEELAINERYFRAYRRLEISKRMEEINQILETKISNKKRLQLLEEFDQCCRRLGIKLRKE